jgi:antitoxin MazE
MEARIQKWGHSLALRIPSSFAKKSKFQPGSRVDFSEIKGKLVITPLENEDSSLEMLLAGVTADNLHLEVDTGDASGREVW